MKKIVLGFVILCGFTSCSTNITDDYEDVSTIKTISENCFNFSHSLNSFAQNLNSDTTLLNMLYLDDLQMPKKSRASVDFDANIENKMHKLSSDILIKSKELLISFGIEDIDNLSDNDIITLSILLYADYMDNYYVKSRGGAITGNHYVDCAFSALGITSITDIASQGLINYSKTVGAKALLKQTAKVVGKGVGFIGWGLALYDFATCV